MGSEEVLAIKTIDSNVRLGAGAVVWKIIGVWEGPMI